MFDLSRSHDTTMSTASIPQPDNSYERWEAIRREAHALAMAGTQRNAAKVAVPDAWQTWSRDLRRGRLSVLGGFFRFVDLLAARDMEMGRKIAVALIGLASEYVDMVLPERKPTLAMRPQSDDVVDIRRAR